MWLFRPYIPPFALCLAVEAGIYYGLFALGASEEWVLKAEVLWLCATVLITLSLGERLERRWRDRDD
jgi:hypothetical protein